MLDVQRKSLCTTKAPLIIWKTDPSEIENLQYKKTADWVLLILFMRINGECKHSHAP